MLRDYYHNLCQAMTLVFTDPFPNPTYRFQALSEALYSACMDITVQELHLLMLAHVHQQGVWLSPALVAL